MVREVRHHDAAGDDPEHWQRSTPPMTDGHELVCLATLATDHKHEDHDGNDRAEDEADDGEDDLDAYQAVPQSVIPAAPRPKSVPRYQRA